MGKPPISLCRLSRLVGRLSRTKRASGGGFKRRFRDRVPTSEAENVVEHGQNTVARRCQF
eukprot:3357529-Prymnesium_polylepis.1